MKGFYTLIAASVLSASIGTAWAATNVSGTIQSIDPQTRELMLDNGKTYTVASNVTLQGLVPGDKVKVSAENKNGKNVIGKIEQTGSAAGQSSAPMQSPTPASPEL